LNGRVADVTPLRLATYNIHRAVGRDGRFDPARIQRVIAEIDADVVALQEVESHHGGFDMLAYFATQTGLTAVPGPTLVHATGEYGNALLPRASLLDVQRLDLSVPNREPRGALDVLLDCGGAPLRVVATHLGPRPAEHRYQVRLWTT
jgi:endonuclease/exonuclease/phosphatase family metal-dependent hydrolase